MAKEKFTVLFAPQASGLTPADWAEKSVVVAGKEKNAGYLEGTEPGLLTKTPIKATVVTILAESGDEAVKAVRKFYGQGTVTGKFLVGKTSGLEELAPQP